MRAHVDYVVCLGVWDGKVLTFFKDVGPRGSLGWNGPGGKVKSGESIQSAATREWGEEVRGVNVPQPGDWLHVMQTHFDNDEEDEGVPSCDVYFMAACVVPTPGETLFVDGKLAAFFEPEYIENRSPSYDFTAACRLAIQHLPMTVWRRPKVVCMCGSTKFKQTWIAENARLTSAGFIVLAVGMWGHHMRKFPSPEEKAFLDELHKRKIDLCDYVYVLDVGGYVGDSTKSEIAYAERIGRRVTYLSHQFHDYTEPIDEVAQERDRLQAWKDEATTVMAGMEDLAATLGPSALGRPVIESATLEIARLRALLEGK